MDAFDITPARILDVFKKLFEMLEENWEICTSCKHQTQDSLRMMTEQLWEKLLKLFELTD
jgi:hypothetical protein